MSEDKIRIEYSQKDIQKALLAHLKDPANTKLAEVIVGYLKNQNHALSGLMKALMNIYPSTFYQKGDMVWIKFSDLPSWKMDKIQTKTLPNYSSDAKYDREGRLLGQIIEVDPYQESPYKIFFSGYEGGVIKEISYIAADFNIAYKEESFLNILDGLEKVDAPKQDDEPF